MQSATTYQQLLDTIESNVEGLQGFLDITEEKISSILLDALKVTDFSKNKEVIRQVLFDYFASYGFRAYILIKHDKEITFRLKINDYDGCIYTTACVDQIPKVGEKLTPNKDRPGTSALHPDAYTSIQTFLDKHIREEEDKRELFKSVLKLYLGLSARDAIFFVDDGVLIKQFHETKTEPAKSAKSDIGKLSTSSKRNYEGLDKKFLAEIDKKTAADGIKKKITNLCADLVKGQLNPSEHDNGAFGKSFVPVLQERFLKFVPDDERIDTPELKQSIANYLLREHFDFCTYQFAHCIVGKLIAKEPKIDAFIKFYDGSVSFSPDGKRFTRPDITDKEGNRWNSATIFQVAMQRKVGLDKIARNAEAIKLTEDTIEKFKADIIKQTKLIDTNLSVSASFEAEIQKKLEVSTKAKENIFELKRRLLSAGKTGEASKEIQNKINALSIQIKQLDRDEKHIFGEKKKIDAEIEKAKARIITYQKDQASYEYKLTKDKEQKEQLAKNQIPLEEKYEVVITAFSKAIAAFRGF